MDMLFIDVGTEHDLVIGQVFLDKPDTELVCKFRRDFAGRKALDNVKRLNAVCFTVPFFCFLHLPGCIFRVAVLTISEHGIVSLIRVLNVADQLIKPHPLGQDLGYRHVFSHSRMSRRTC